jgi:probable rRNA maturation factor
MNITIRNRQHEYVLPRMARTAIRRALWAAARSEGLSAVCEVTVTITDDEKIRYLNHVNRGIDRSTDVLSFPLGEDGNFDINPETGGVMLGDMVISFPHAVRQAFEYGHSLERECAFLAVHSMLHLLGYDHETGEADERIMNEKTEAILKTAGYAREVKIEA